MTRGYVVITDGKNNISAVGYLNSDAHLNYYGLQVLKAVNTDTITSYVEDLYKRAPEDCKDFDLNWIRPDKASREEGRGKYDYEEYGYIYDLKSNVLKVYNYGKILFTIKRDEILKYMYIFENEYAIYSAISYDAEKLDDTVEFEVAMKKAAKCDMDELTRYVRDANSNERVYLSDTHCIVPGHRPDNEMYQKKLTSSKRGWQHLDFIVEHDHFTKRWEVLLQTPFCRTRCIYSGKSNDGSYSSEKAAVQGIRDYVKKVGTKKMFRLAEIIDMYDAAKKDGTKYAILKFRNNIEAEFTKSEWWIPSGSLTPDSFKSEISKEYITK